MAGSGGQSVRQSMMPKPEAQTPDSRRGPLRARDRHQEPDRAADGPILDIESAKLVATMRTYKPTAIELGCASEPGNAQAGNSTLNYPA
jgi:hypothetical protein